MTPAALSASTPSDPRIAEDLPVPVRDTLPNLIVPHRLAVETRLFLRGTRLQQLFD